MSERIGDWMQTYSGIKFWPLDPRPEEIHVIDIAHSLANQCRFAGHCRRFYSVAQHSVLVSRAVPEEFAMWGLLHDASEAYLVDLPRPIKRFSALGDAYRNIESTVMAAICQRFGLAYTEPDCIRWTDDRVLMTERRDLMVGGLKWRDAGEPLNEPILPSSQERAEEEFLFRAEELKIRWRYGAV